MTDNVIQMPAPRLNPEFPHRYFVTYNYGLRGQGGIGYGGFAVELALPMRWVDDVYYVTSRIQAANPTFDRITVTGWQKFEDES